jgi:hypothetical protein
MTVFERTTPRLVEPDTEENLQQQFLDNHWTDGLPVVLPTEKRVAAMLAATSRKPDEVVGRMQPTEFRAAWEYTVEKVAVNAVMAGAKPEYFPVILALAASQVTARGSTSSSSSAMVVVNGPIRHEINMNWGTGAMGPYNHANATIGRAYGLLSQNLQGGSEPGVTFMGSQGNSCTYNNVTFAENEERSPWEPLHVQKGYKPTDSAVSIFYGCRSTTFCLGLARNTGASTCATCSPASTATRRPACCLIRSRRDSSSIAAASTARKSSFAGCTRPPRCRPGATGIWPRTTS